MIEWVWRKYENPNYGMAAMARLGISSVLQIQLNSGKW